MKQNHRNKGQRGFTLIELLAVMAIMAVLVGVVAPAVTGTRDASVDAQVLQDATQVRSAASDYYGDIDEAEVRTPHTIVTTSKMPVSGGGPAMVTAQQITSNRWPERFISLQVEGTSSFVAAPANVEAIGAGYAGVIPTAPADNIDEVVLLDKRGHAISGNTLLTRYTAIDIRALVKTGDLQQPPAGTELESDGIPNFLWLFEKTNSSRDRTDDNREVAVFKLVNVLQLEGQPATTELMNATNGAVTFRPASHANKVKVTYERIFGQAADRPLGQAAHDVIIDADGFTSPLAGIPGAVDVRAGDTLRDFGDPWNSGVDMFDRDASGTWTSGDDLMTEETRFGGTRNGQFVAATDKVILDIDGSLQDGDQVNFDLDGEAPMLKMRYYDANNNAMWDNGEDIILDTNDNHIYD